MRFLALFLALFSFEAKAQVGSTATACIWQGTVAACLPSNGLLLNNQKDLRLGEATANGSNYVALQAPATIATDFTLTLPADDGDNFEILGTNGSGTLDWTLINSPSFFTTGAAASNSAIGILTTSAQNVAGLKTFYDGVVLDDAAGQSTLNHYEEETYASVNFRGSSTGSGSTATVQIRATRVGRIVTLEIPAVTITTSGTDAEIATRTTGASNNFLGTEFRPTVETFLVLGRSISGAISQTGPSMIRVTTTGDIVIYRDGTGGVSVFGTGTSGLESGLSVAYTK